MKYTKEFILNLDKEYEELKARTHEYTLWKMYIFERGWGKKDINVTFDTFKHSNSFEDFEITEKSLICYFDDYYYDCRDICSESISFDEINQSLEECKIKWEIEHQKEIQKLKFEIKLNEEKLQKEKDQKEYNQYQKLKQKYENNI